MSNTGKYVRAPAYESEEESINELECGDVFSPGRFVRLNPSNEDFGDVDAQENDPYADYYRTVDPDQETRELRQKVQELEKTIAELSGAKTSDPEHDRTTATVSSCDISAPSIRWDNMKPFPSGVPANKMWETWTKYFENFEIAASLSNAHDPVKRSQLLFLSIGDELQGIIRAAKLRPVTNEPDCYAVFVKNIEDYLKALTDTA
ncbi:uncharacterized protein LOC129738561 [Uranotaenia lowii]|uniref:uncharacterized protein LOC129738561 n=1 Tax=Uranotaenia lowii TaxID=190385 RepID=UPI00247A4B8E|nr:uncharacterized protein LOC129738561 [Uranotaenia lowii]